MFPKMSQPVASLEGRTMLVTGASSGIGRAIAIAAARAGADVALTYRANDAGAREVEREIWTSSCASTCAAP
jgi:NAD(P)-dependent dehydrogenase (short-subunit alcohol dehydrogenase family)